MTFISTTETKQLLRQFLMQDTDIAALVEGRVFGAHLEDADAQTVLKAGPMVIFEFLSGKARWHGAVQTQTFEVYGFSKRSNDEATQVYDAVVERLQHCKVQIVGIDMTGVTRETQRPVDGYTSSVGAWFCRGRWSINTG